MGYERHAYHFLGNFRRFVRVLRDLHSPAFAPAARMNLGLHNDAAADLFSGRLRFLHGIGDFAPRHRDVVFGQNGLRLVFMNFHNGIGFKRHQ